MNVLKRLLCEWFKYCVPGYTDECDPVIDRIDNIDKRVTRIEDSYWKPRDLFDLR